jgi:hypothetical protein
MDRGVGHRKYASGQPYLCFRPHRLQPRGHERVSLPGRRGVPSACPDCPEHLRGLQCLHRRLGRFRRLSLQRRDRILDSVSVALAQRLWTDQLKGTVVVESVPSRRQRDHRCFERRYTPKHVLVEVVRRRLRARGGGRVRRDLRGRSRRCLGEQTDQRVQLRLQGGFGLGCPGRRLLDRPGPCPRIRRVGSRRFPRAAGALAVVGWCGCLLIWRSALTTFAAARLFVGAHRPGVYPHSIGRQTARTDYHFGQMRPDLGGAFVKLE